MFIYIPAFSYLTGNTICIHQVAPCQQRGSLRQCKLFPLKAHRVRVCAAHTWLLIPLRHLTCGTDFKKYNCFSQNQEVPMALMLVTWCQWLYVMAKKSKIASDIKWFLLVMPSFNLCSIAQAERPYTFLSTVFEC